MTVQYRIDAADRLVEVDQGWADFAAANGAPELVVPPAESLWGAIQDDELNALWRLLVRRARQGSEPVEIRCRCDSPTMRRWFAISLTPGPDESVQFRSVARRQEERPAVALLDRDVARDPDAPLVRVCSWCARVAEGDHWVPIEVYVSERRLLEQARLPGLTHGICPACAATL